MTIRGGGNPHTAMAAMPLGEWTRRLGALLAEAYDCFMVGTLHGSTEYKRGSRAIARGQWQAPPRIIAWQTTRSRAVCRRARVGQGQAFGGAEEAPSLTLAARDGDGQYAVGAEECSRRGSNKRINKQGRDKMVCTTLDKESPIQAVCPNWARTDLMAWTGRAPCALVEGGRIGNTCCTSHGGTFGSCMIVARRAPSPSSPRLRVAAARMRA